MKKILIIGSILLVITVSLSGCTEQQNSDTSVKDTDGDGYNNDVDAFPNDPGEWKDSDNDGVGDNGDAFPNNKYEQYDSDNDGVGNNADAFPYDSTQWIDRDGDGHGDNPNGKDPDDFPDDPSEWRDSDIDGIGDNKDIYDDGNAGITIKITKFQSYGSDTNEDGGLPDPMFSVYGEARPDPNKLGESFSSDMTDAFVNQQIIYDPLMYTVDIPDDTYSLYVSVDVMDGVWNSNVNSYVIDEYIDLSGDDATVGATSAHQTSSGSLRPRTTSYFSFTDDGRLDYVEGEIDGYIEWEIKIGEV